MSTLIRLACIAVLVLPTAAAPSVLAADERPLAEAPDPITKRDPTRFIRVRYDEYQSPVALQTATARYVMPDSDGQPRLEVFLEGVVHVADRAYYRGFERRFRSYDAVLYELVAPPEKRIPRPGSQPNHPLRFLQQLVADGLGFTHQIDVIDYAAANMVHADVSPAELAEAVVRRGDDDLTLLLDAMLDTLRRVNRELAAGPEPPDLEPMLDISVLADPDGAVKLRRMLAAVLAASDSPEAVLNPARVALLIRDRDERAMHVFQEQLDQGKRRIAFFWGAGHMEDFERRLLLGYGLQPNGVVWRDAWDLREGAVARAPLETILEKSLRGTIGDTVRELFQPPTREP